MPFDQSLVGREYPPAGAYEVSREKIREFADAVGDPALLYREPAAARQAGHSDVIAPPTFAMIPFMRAQDAVVSDLGVQYSQVVHGSQEFTHHRPITAGDRLVTTAHLDSIRSRAGSDFVTVRAEIGDAAGTPVCTAKSMVVIRDEAGERP